MECKNCGSKLAIDMEFCPYCGKPNVEAKKHIDDMKHYNAEFEKTRRQVLINSKWFTKYFGLMVVIVILAVANVSLIISYNMIYSIKMKQSERQAEERAEEYTAVIDSYEKSQRYYEINRYIDILDIHAYKGSYRPYSAVEDAAYYYNSVFVNLMTLVDTDVISYSSSTLSGLGSNLVSFYDIIEARGWYADNAFNEIHLSSLNEMEDRVKVMLKVYAHLTDEDIKKISEGASSNEVISIISRRMENE